MITYILRKESVGSWTMKTNKIEDVLFFLKTYCDENDVKTLDENLDVETQVYSLLDTPSGHEFFYEYVET